MPIIRPIIMFIFLSGSFVYSQENWKNNLDTIITYNEQVVEYTFQIKGMSQGFSWDTITSLPENLRFKIVNNTESAIFLKRVGGGDGALRFKSLIADKYFFVNAPDSAILAPDSFLLVQPIIYSRKHRFTKPLRISFDQNDSSKSFVIKTWGFISP